MMPVGPGVGVDYALLVFHRYRHELVRGADAATATRTALDAAGRTVFFAGCTVIIALLGLVALSDTVGARLPLFVAVVVGLSALLLTWSSARCSSPSRPHC